MKEGATQGGLPVRAEPLQRAEKISRMAVDLVGVEHGALPLEVDPQWAGAINASPVARAVGVDEARKKTKAEERLMTRSRVLPA